MRAKYSEVLGKVKRYFQWAAKAILSMGQHRAGLLDTPEAVPL
jgi:hypothetical protein